MSSDGKRRSNPRPHLTPRFQVLSREKLQHPVHLRHGRVRHGDRDQGARGEVHASGDLRQVFRAAHEDLQMVSAGIRFLRTNIDTETNRVGETTSERRYHRLGLSIESLKISSGSYTSEI